MSDDARADLDVPSGPPYPLDLLADLHAGVLDEDVATALWPRAQADPQAARVLAALDATRTDLGAAEVTPEAPPPAVAAAIDATLSAIRAEGAPVRAQEVESIDDARARLRDGRRRRGMVIASVAAGVIAVVTLVIAVSTASLSSQGTVRTADGPSASPAQTSSGPIPAATLLSVLGRSGAAFSSPRSDNDPQRLTRCLAANGVAPTVPVVGSGPITVEGRPAVVVLLSTGQAGRFDALVVGPGCDTGSPATLDRTQLGAALPPG